MAVGLIGNWVNVQLHVVEEQEMSLVLALILRHLAMDPYALGRILELKNATCTVVQVL